LRRRWRGEDGEIAGEGEQRIAKVAAAFAVEVWEDGGRGDVVAAFTADAAFGVDCSRRREDEKRW